MSVGGRVVEVQRFEDRIWVATKERDYPRDEPTAVYVERNEDSEWICPGDSLWWQMRTAYWTPQTLERRDVTIPRIGYSHTERP